MGSLAVPCATNTPTLLFGSWPLPPKITRAPGCAFSGWKRSTTPGSSVSTTGVVSLIGPAIVIDPVWIRIGSRLWMVMLAKTLAFGPTTNASSCALFCPTKVGMLPTAIIVSISG